MASGFRLGGFIELKPSFRNCFVHCSIRSVPVNNIRLFHNLFKIPSGGVMLKYIRPISSSEKRNHLPLLAVVASQVTLDAS